MKMWWKSHRTGFGGQHACTLGPLRAGVPFPATIQERTCVIIVYSMVETPFSTNLGRLLWLWIRGDHERETFWWFRDRSAPHGQGREGILRFPPASTDDQLLAGTKFRDPYHHVHAILSLITCYLPRLLFSAHCSPASSSLQECTQAAFAHWLVCLQQTADSCPEILKSHLHTPRKWHLERFTTGSAVTLTTRFARIGSDGTLHTRRHIVTHPTS